MKTSRYAEQLGQPISVSIKFKKDEYAETSRNGPDEEAIQAFLLTLRLFVQDRDGISLRKMTERIAALNVDDVLKTKFQDRYRAFNAYLDGRFGPPYLRIGDGDYYTCRQIFDTFTYGKYAHLEHDEQVKDWENRLIGDELRAAYDMILRRMLTEIISLADIAAAIVEALSA